MPVVRGALARRLFLLMAVFSVVLPIALATPATRAGAGQSPTLRVVSSNVSASRATVVISVPPNLANLVLPASAFGVRQDGRPLPVSVQRVVDSGLDVYVVLDTTPTNLALIDEQSAAADLLRQLPVQVRTAAVTSANTITAPELGNVAALQAVAAAKQGPALAVGKTLDRIAAAAVPGGRRQLIVLMTSCPADSSTDVSHLRAALSNGSSQLDIVGTGAACNSPLLSLARSRGGLVRLGVAFDQLDAAADAIGYDILGQYRLSVPAPAKATPVMATVDFAGVAAGSQLVLPAAAPAAFGKPGSSPRAGTSSGKAGSSRLPAVLAILAGLILLVYIAAAVLWTRVRRRRTGSAPSRRPPTRDWTEAPTAGRHAKVEPPPAPVPAVDAASGELPAGAPSAPAEPPASAAPEPASPMRARQLGLPASGLGDGTVRVRLPRSDDTLALHRYAESDGGLAGEWVPLAVQASWADCDALVDSWMRAWDTDQASSNLGLIVALGNIGVVIGYVELLVKPHGVEVRYGTAPPHRGHGYARRALRLVADWLTEQEPDRQVEMVILAEEDGCRALARDVGFVQAGTVRTFIPTTGKVSLSVRFVYQAGDHEPAAAESR